MELEGELDRFKALVVDKDNARLEAEAEMRECRALRARLEEACLSAALKRRGGLPAARAQVGQPSHAGRQQAGGDERPQGDGEGEAGQAADVGGQQWQGGATGAAGGFDEARAAGSCGMGEAPPRPEHEQGGGGGGAPAEVPAGGEASLNPRESPRPMGARASEAVKEAANAARATAAAAADKTKASLEAAALLAEQASASAVAHIPPGLRGAFEDLCSRSKAVADALDQRTKVSTQPFALRP